MEHELPDAVRTRDGMAARLPRGQAGQQLEDRGTVPCPTPARSPELLVQSFDFGAHLQGLHCMIRSYCMATLAPPRIQWLTMTLRGRSRESPACVGWFRDP